MQSDYIHYGCGLDAPAAWTNYDASPTLFIQKLPLVGRLIKRWLNTNFPSNVKYGNIIKGLPVAHNSCKGLYCSHVLEHLSLQDFRKALLHSYQMLQPGGTFRLVVPDLYTNALEYIQQVQNGNALASFEFLLSTMLGSETRAKGLKGFIVNWLGNSNHLWMWDSLSMRSELEKVGFKHIRVCNYGDAKDPMFLQVENKSRFEACLAMEAVK